MSQRETVEKIDSKTEKRTVYYNKSDKIKCIAYYVKSSKWKYPRLHREDGPAVTHFDKDGNIERETYWLDNRIVDKI